MTRFEEIKTAVDNGTYKEPSGLELAEVGAKKIMDVGARIRARAKKIAEGDREMQRLHEILKGKR